VERGEEARELRERKFFGASGGREAGIEQRALDARGIGARPQVIAQRLALLREGILQKREERGFAGDAERGFFARRSESDERGIHLRRRAERTGGNLETQFDTRAELREDGKIAVVTAAGARGEAFGDFALDHKERGIEAFGTLEDAMHDGRGDVVRKVAVDAVAFALRERGEEAGEPFWELPLVDSYEKHLESEVADVKNIGKAGNGGTIVAAVFLRRFAKGRPWAHLDIASTARAERDDGYLAQGGTAFSLRTLVAYLLGRAAS